MWKNLIKEIKKKYFCFNGSLFILLSLELRYKPTENLHLEQKKRISKLFLPEKKSSLDIVGQTAHVLQSYLGLHCPQKLVW